MILEKIHDFRKNSRVWKKFMISEKMAVFTLEDEQIVWTDKSSDGLFD